MRKVLAIVAVTVLVAGLFTGCGGAQKATAPTKPTRMILATGGTAGTYHPYGGDLAQIFNSKIPNTNVTAQVSGASIENLRLVNKKEAELAIVQNDTMDYAYNGKEMFKDKLSNVRGIAILYPEIIQVVVRSDSGINHFGGLRGKKVGVGAPGSGTEANFRQLMDVCGLDYRSLSPAYLSFAESADQFKEKNIDGFIVTAGIPNSAINDISAQHSVKILAFPDDMIAKLGQKYPFLTPYTIPANTYKNQAEPVKTVAVQATLIVNAEVRDDVVYNLTKALFENQAELAKANIKGKELNLQAAVKGMSIPLHPGAEKYFKEKGVIK